MKLIKGIWIEWELKNLKDDEQVRTKIVLKREFSEVRALKRFVNLKLNGKIAENTVLTQRSKFSKEHGKICLYLYLCMYMFIVSMWHERRRIEM